MGKSNIEDVEDIKLERPRNIIEGDNAIWHKKKSWDWGFFEPLFLLHYSPDVNSIERLWLPIKAGTLCVDCRYKIC